jgi:GNAT superfamily N-acetyltransferase
VPLKKCKSGEPALIKVDYLKNHPEQVKTCAQWSFEMWGHHKPDQTLETFIESRKRYLNDDKLPLTLLAFDGAIPIGMCSLAENRGLQPGLCPWLAALYVHPKYRNQGIGKLLEESICKKARKMGYPKIYLFTSDQTVIPWYEKLKWRKKETAWLHNHEVTIMEKDLTTS